MPDITSRALLLLLQTCGINKSRGWSWWLVAGAQEQQQRDSSDNSKRQQGCDSWKYFTSLSDISLDSRIAISLSMSHTSSPPFYSLPAELRVLVYEHHARDALVSFTQHFRLPALLHVDHRTRDEYGDVFFADENMMLYEYHPLSGAWSAVEGKDAKIAAFRHPSTSFSDLFDRSLASAQRYVQRVYTNQSGVRRGILTISISRVPRWWQWSIVNG